MKTEHILLHRLINNYLIAAIPNYYLGAFECDLFTLNKNLYTTEYEIKKTVADFKKDFDKDSGRYIWRDKTFNKDPKHKQIQDGLRTNRFYFVMPKDLAARVEIPEYAGLLVYDPTEEWTFFKEIKNAKMLHKRKTEATAIQHLVKIFSWRHYSLIYSQFEGGIKRNAKLD